MKTLKKNTLLLTIIFGLGIGFLANSNALLEARSLPIYYDDCDWSPSNHVCMSYPDLEGGHYHLCTVDENSSNC